MSDTKQPKPMTAKKFLHQSGTKAANSAISFLKQHRDFLISGEIASVTSPLIRKLDDGQLLPTPCLREIQNAIITHMLVVATRKQERSLERQQGIAQGEEKESRSQKPWQATVYDCRGNVCTRVKNNGEIEDLVKTFDLSQQAVNWLDLRLFNGAPDWYGKLEHASSSCVEYIQRGDAVARVLRKKKGPTVHVKGLGTQTLGFGVKCGQTKVTFSHG